MNPAPPEDVAAILADGEWEVWVLEFGLTHHLMKLVLHKGDYPHGVDLLCRFPETFCGALQGGPYRLHLEHESTPRGDLVVLVGNDSELRIRCEAIEFVRRRP
jgi:hypothetical protein